MALKIVTGNIMDNWGKCSAIYLSAHFDINPVGHYYLNNSAITIVKNIIPDFDDVFTQKIKDAREKSHDKNKGHLFGVLTYNASHDDVPQQIGLFFNRVKWGDPPRPDIYKLFLDNLFVRFSYLVLVGLEPPRVVVQCPIKADTPPTKKGIEAIERLYDYYPPFIEIWQPTN